jgi:hypothetical protein
MMTHQTPPSMMTDDLRRLTALELSWPARLRYVALLLGASSMTAVVAALLVTEPALPARTTIALATLVAIGLGWMGFAAWVLTHRRIMLGRQRVVAGRLAVGANSVFVIGALLVGGATGQPSAFAAAGLGVLMLAAAVVMLLRANATFRRLSSRREELARQLGK